MVDIEPEIFSRVYNLVKTAYPNCDVIGEQMRKPSAFPCVYVEETRNNTNRETIDSSGECHSNVTYEINIYTDDATGKKSKAKEILALIDADLVSINFTRTSTEPSYQKYTEYYRLIARYTATVSKDKIIGRR